MSQPRKESRSLPRAGPEPPKDWEDQYHRVKAELNELKTNYHFMDEHNRKLQAKIRKLEADFSNGGGVGGGGGGGPVNSGPQAREDEQLVSKLYEENTKLKGIVAALKGKNKQLIEIIEKKKRELALAKKSGGGTDRAGSLRSTSVGTLPSGTTGAQQRGVQDVDIRPAPNPTRRSGGGLEILQSNNNTSNSSAAAQADSNLLEVARKYKARLTAAEEQIAAMRDENSRLRAGGGSAGLGAVSRSSAASAAVGGDHNQDSQLRDAGWRLQQLQTQYDFLVSKTSSQGQANKLIEEQMEVRNYIASFLPHSQQKNTHNYLF